MKIYTYSEAEKNFSSVPDMAENMGKVFIKRGVSHFLHIGFDDIAIPPEDA